MSKTTNALLTRYLQNAQAIAWDECHAIYIVRDGVVADYLLTKGNFLILPAQDFTIPQLRSILNEWYAQSCDSKFIVAAGRSSENARPRVDLLAAPWS